MYPFLFQNQFAPKIWLFLSLTFCLINSLQVIAKPVNSQPVAAQSASALPASSQSAGLIEISNQQEEEILAFVEKFRVAIIQKDKVGFLDLFLDTSMKWTDVLSDYTLDEVKVKRPEISKVSTGDPLEFINSIVKDPKTLEEKFYNLNIQTDGDVASVIFDYEFFEGDFKSNWGKEAWLLAKTEKGWKISSVAFSVTLNPERHSRPQES